MKAHRLLLLLISTFCFLHLLKGNSFSQESISHLAEKYRPSVVAVIALDQENKTIRTGTGFFVDRRGVIATSHHVLEGSARAIIRVGDRQEGEVLDILSDDPDCDLLTAKTSLQKTFPIPFGDSYRITEGEEVLIIGHSPGWERIFSAGHIIGSRKAGNLEASAGFSAPFSRVQRRARFEPQGRGSGCGHGFCRCIKGSQFRGPHPLSQNAQTCPDKLEVPSREIRTVPGLHGGCYGH